MWNYSKRCGFQCRENSVFNTYNGFYVFDFIAHCWASFSALRALLSSHIMTNKNDDNDDVVISSPTNMLVQLPCNSAITQRIILMLELGMLAVLMVELADCCSCYTSETRRDRA